jgi:hypothetical protein
MEKLDSDEIVATSPEVLREHALRRVKKRRDFHAHASGLIYVAFGRSEHVRGEGAAASWATGVPASIRRRRLLEPVTSRERFLDARNGVTDNRISPTAMPTPWVRALVAGVECQSVRPVEGVVEGVTHAADPLTGTTWSGLSSAIAQLSRGPFCPLPRERRLPHMLPLDSGFAEAVWRGRDAPEVGLPQRRGHETECRATMSHWQDLPGGLVRLR